MKPIKTEFIKLKKWDLIQNRCLIAIDSGNSLTKVLFLNKSFEEEFLNENSNQFTLEFSLFPNSEFENSLMWIKDHAYQLENSSSKIHITGIFAINNRKKIISILKRDVTVIDEFITISTGHKLALENIGIDNMISENVEVENYGTIDNEIINKYIESMKNKLQLNDDCNDKISLYPSLFHVHGSSSGCFYFDSNGVPEYFGIKNKGGKMFLGLAKCLLDTNNYDEITDLASKGNRANIDTQVKEMLDENINSPYGKFPPELPIFSFGKSADYDKGLCHFNKEDIAASLVSFQAQQILFFCATICMMKKISKVYLTGNFFKSNVFQKEIQTILNAYPVLVDFVFLNCGYLGALGAMFSDENDAADFSKYCIA